MSWTVRTLRDPGLIEALLRRDEALHVYELADLDPAQWPHTRWYGGDRDGEVLAVALLYEAADPPVLLLLGRGVDPERTRLLDALQPRLPDRIQAHLAPGLQAGLGAFEVHDVTEHRKMVLARRDVPEDDDEVETLGPADRPEIERRDAHAYPTHVFDPRTLQTGAVVGLRVDGALASVAGIHALSGAQRVAALGNIATDPRWRGRGLARRVTGALCRRLAPAIETIGLNVRADNAAAIALYRRLGFEVVTTYLELNAHRR